LRDPEHKITLARAHIQKAAYLHGVKVRNRVPAFLQLALGQHFAVADLVDVVPREPVQLDRVAIHVAVAGEACGDVGRELADVDRLLAAALRPTREHAVEVQAAVEAAAEAPKVEEALKEQPSSEKTAESEKAPQ